MRLRNLGCQMGSGSHSYHLVLPMGKLRLKGSLIRSKGLGGAVPCSESPSQVQIKSLILHPPFLPGCDPGTRLLQPCPSLWKDRASPTTPTTPFVTIVPFFEFIYL